MEKLIGSCMKLIALLLIVSSLACSRAKEEKVMVTFNLPQSSSALSEAPIVAQSGGEWGQMDPSSLADIGCYLIFVGGSEASMSNNSCFVGTGANFKTIRFGEGKGLFASGASISLEVTPGDRKFYVLGAKKGSLACGTFSLSNPDSLDQNNLSTPVLLGEAQKVVASGTDTVNINLALTSLENQKLSGCNFMSNSNGVISKVRIEGPYQNYNGSNALLKLGTNLCNKFRLKLVDSNDNGGGFNETARSITVSKTGSAQVRADVYSDATCTTLATSVNFLPGESEKAVYIKADSTPASLGDVILNFTTASGFSGAATTSSADVMSTSTSSGQYPYFYDQHLRMAGGQCKEIDFAIFDGSGYTTDTSYTAVTALITDLNNGNAVSSFPGDAISAFYQSCSSPTTSASYTGTAGRAYNTMFYKMGSAHYDFQLRAGASSNYAYLPVNVVPKAASLAVAPSSNTVIAGDCVTMAVSAKDTAGNAADLTGNDYSYWAIAKRILGKFSGSGGTYYYSDAACATPDNSSQSFNLVNGSATKNFYMRFAQDTSTTVYSHAWPFISGETTKLVVNPIWSPVVLGNTNLHAWLMSDNINGSTGIAPTYWSSPSYLNNLGISNAYTFSPNSVAAPTTTDESALKSGARALTFSHTEDQGMYSGTLGAGSGSFTTSLLVFVDTNGTDGSNPGEILTFADSTTAAHLNLRISATNDSLKLNSTTVVDSTGLDLYTSLIKNKWSVITVTRDGSTYEQKVYVNGALKSTDTGTSVTISHLHLGAWDTSTLMSFRGKIAETFSSYNKMSDADVLKAYTFMKTKYPNAALP